ncbi:MAG: tetratricopeptide repeat protein [Candidatus Heimdallarchaeota archaeon]|nr:tetratricopeptide repeat protein [Candidatus Heimdallarchaeota archaeon]
MSNVSLVQIKELIDQGRLLEAKENLDNYSDTKDPNVWLLQSTLNINYNQPQIALQYANRAFIQSQQQGDVDLEFSSTVTIALYLYSMKNLDEALKEAKKAEKLFSSLLKPDNLDISWNSTLTNLLGNIYREKFQFQKSLTYYNKFLKLQDNKNKLAIAKTNNNIGITYWYRGLYDKAIEFYKNSIQLFSSLNEINELGSVMNNLGILYYSLGDMNEALNYLVRSMELFRSTSNKQKIAFNLISIGNVYHSNGNIESAKQYYENSLELLNETKSNTDIATALNNIGISYKFQGELDIALEYYINSLNLFEKEKNTFGTAQAQNNIGVIFEEKGDLETALEFYHEAEQLHKKIGSKPNRAGTLGNIGHIMYLMKEYEKAILYMEESYTILDKIGNDINTSIIVFDLIMVNLKLNQKSADIYINKLEELDKRTNNPYIKQRLKLIQALKLKSSQRMISKVEAQKLLNEIVSEEILLHSISIIAMLNLCEIYIDEYKLYQHQAVLDDILSISQKISLIAQKQNSYSMLIESYILQSKINFISGDIQSADELIKLGFNIAEKNNLSYYKGVLEHEQNVFHQQLQLYTKLVEAGESMTNRLNELDIKSYLDRMIRLSRDYSDS